MKNLKRSIISFLVILLLVVSSFIPSYAAEGSLPSSYSSEYNSGQRDVICTTLDGTSASSYYTGSYTYDTLSDLSSSVLYSNLQTLMRSTHTYISSYDDCHYKADRTDCQNGDGSVSLIYTSYSATMSQWNGWNREHVWPKSLGGNNTTGGGADLHHIRPSDAVVNSTRSNKKYGEADGGTEVYGKNPATGYLGGSYSGNYFEPEDNVKGDVARICLYVYVRWGSAWGAEDITDVFESVDVLLAWCELDPVDSWEMGRNEVVQDIQGNRNVFIDYPEYAWLLFDKEVPDDMTTPSGEASGGNTSSGSSDSGSSTPDVDEGDNSPVGKTETTATVNIGNYATANGWSDSKQYTTVEVDSNITATASSGTNTGKYYTNGTNWRLYQTENATLTITAAENCTIESIKITYSSSNSGVLKFNGSSVSSGATVDVNASSATFNVGNSGTATNGQARITAIEVTYTQSSSSTCSHTNTSRSTIDATCTDTGSVTVTCNDCQAIVSSETVSATGHSYNTDGICTVCNETLPKYACSFMGPEDTEASEILGNSITMPAAPTLSGEYKYTYTFVGWAKDTVNNSTTAPELFQTGDTVIIDEDTTFYAVYTYGEEGEASTSFVKTDISDINDTDEVIITMTTANGTVYALTGGNGTSKAPAATIITVSGNTVVGEVADTLKWNISYDNGSFIIYPNGDTSTWLYCTSTNNGVRVGTNSAKIFTIDAASGYIKHTGTSRYLGVYTTTPDWRCYTNTTGNTANQMLAFYVLPASSGTETFYTSKLTAADGTSTCEHTSTFLTTVNATCTTAGTTTVTCNLCSNVVSRTEIPATGHTVVTDAKVDATCTESGLTEGSHCSICSEVIVAQETIDALGHNYTDGTCSNCGESVPTDALGLDDKKFYIATKRTEGNYFYMTSDLGTASTKRYQAVDSGLTTLPEYIINANNDYIFVFEFNEDGTYYIYAYGIGSDAKYLGYTSGNSGTLVEKANALRLTVDYTDGFYHISFNNKERYLELNNQSQNGYFAFYAGTQCRDLSLIPVSESTCTHENTTTTVVQSATCTEEGFRTTVCNDCDEFVSSEAIAALGHDLVTNADSVICARCGYTEQYTPPAGTPTESGWVLVTDVSTLKAGDRIIIVAMGTSKGDFIAGDISSSIMASVSITDDTFATLPTGAVELTLGGSSGAWTFANSSGKLLGATAVKKVAWGSGTTTWSISIDNDGNATIYSTNSSYGRILYNVNSPRFTTYTSNTSVSMLLPQIYKYESGSSNAPTDDVSIYGASMTVGSTLAMNYYVSGCVGSSYYMTFTMNGVTSEHIKGVEKYGYLVFSFENIPPQCMGEIIEATLYKDDGTVIIESFEFSVKAYSEKILEYYEDNKELTDLVADMLRYGAAAQAYKNYKADALVTDELDELLEGKGSDAAPNDEVDNVRSLTTAEGTKIDTSIYSFTAAGVRFDFDNKIYVKFKAEDVSNVKIKCNGKNVPAASINDLGDGTYAVYTDGIHATEFDETFTFELYVDGVLHQTITYSVNSYVCAKYQSENLSLKALVVALYKYGVSAKNYTA